MLLGYGGGDRWLAQDRAILFERARIDRSSEIDGGLDFELLGVEKAAV